MTFCVVCGLGAKGQCFRCGAGLCDSHIAAYPTALHKLIDNATTPAAPGNTRTVCGVCRDGIVYEALPRVGAALNARYGGSQERAAVGLAQMSVWETLDYDNDALRRGRPGTTSGADLIAAMGSRPRWLAADLTICLARLFAFAAAQRRLRPPQVGLVVAQILARKSLWSGKATTERHRIQMLGSMALWQIVTHVHDGPDGGIFIRQDGHCFALGVTLRDASQRPVGQIGVNSELDVDPFLWSGNGYYEPRLIFDWCTSGSTVDRTFSSYEPQQWLAMVKAIEQLL